MEALDKVNKALDLWQEGHKKFDEASKVLSSGGGDYYYKKINTYVNALFENFSPFKEGDTVKIVKVPNTNNGWHHCKHFLVLGAAGVVREVDYRDGHFTAEVIWNKETFFDHNGDEKPVSSKHRFLMYDTQIEKVESYKKEVEKNCDTCVYEIGSWHCGSCSRRGTQPDNDNWVIRPSLKQGVRK